MTVTRGKEHYFVEIDSIFKDNGTVDIYQYEYIQELIEVFGEVMRRVDTPAKYDLFNVESEVEMSEDRLENSHHIVATLLYVSKRARVDIDLAVLFLCTRVSRDTEEDWDKLRRLLNYLLGTIYIYQES